MSTVASITIAAILWGLACAFVGVVYAVVLAEDDTPLNKWYELLRWAQERGGWTSWLSSPLGGCQNCFSGQLALWSFSIVLPMSIPSAFQSSILSCTRNGRNRILICRRNAIELGG